MFLYDDNDIAILIWQYCHYHYICINYFVVSTEPCNLFALQQVPFVQWEIVFYIQRKSVDNGRFGIESSEKNMFAQVQSLKCNFMYRKTEGFYFQNSSNSRIKMHFGFALLAPIFNQASLKSSHPRFYNSGLIQIELVVCRHSDYALH